MAEARILVVEDEFMMALDLVSTVEEAGYAVVGPAGTLEQALVLARSFNIDAALLDLNLWGRFGRSTPGKRRSGKQPK